MYQTGLINYIGAVTFTFLNTVRIRISGFNGSPLQSGDIVSVHSSLSCYNGDGFNDVFGWTVELGNRIDPYGGSFGLGFAPVNTANPVYPFGVLIQANNSSVEVEWRMDGSGITGDHTMGILVFVSRQ